MNTTIIGDGDRLITLSHLAEALGTTTRTLHRWRQADQDHSLFTPDIVKVGNAKLVSVEQARIWCRQHYKTLTL